MEELEPAPAQVTFDEHRFLKALGEYRRAVTKGDPEGDLDIRTEFDVTVSGSRYAGGMQQVVSDHHGQPTSVLVSITSDTPWSSDRQAYVVLTCHADDPAKWAAEQRIYHGDLRTEPVVMWLNRAD